MNIKTFSSSVFLILTTGLCIPHVGAQCTTTPPKVPTAVATTIVSTSYVIYQCFNGIFYSMFSTGDFVLSSSCTGVTWSTIGGTCEFTIALFRCSPTGPVVPQSAVLLKDEYPAYKAYVCGTGLRWLSGSFVRISQCNNTQWTPIIDICEDAVTPLPRDCSDIFDLGFTTNGNYYAVTSGNAALPYLLTPITCQMNDSTYGTRWTYVLNNTLPIPLAITKASYLNGYAGTHLFLGLQALSALSLDLSGHLQGMILQVLLNVSIPSLSVYQVFHATFDNFTIGSAPNYSLVSLGNYYGNAGDGLTPHIGKTFNTTFPAWWGVNAPTEAMAIMGSILTGSTMTWAPILSAISDSTIIRAEMKIRPYRVDYGSFCPATFGAWPSWLSTTEGFVPVSRLPGSVLTYQCVNPYLEGAPGGPTTSSGNITCLNTLPPTWTKFPNLPCTFHCPAGFVFSYDKTSCLYYSTDVQTFVNASLACLDLNSSLATFNDTLDLSGNYSTSTLYYTGYSQRGSSQLSIQPPIPSFLSCLDAPCLTYSLSQCVQMFGNGSYTLQTSCLDERNYVCKLSDPYCPPSFWKADGGCYTFISSSSSALDYLLECESLGASLAYPTSTNQTYAISNGLIVNQGVSSSYALIGANNVNGNWTDDGTFMVQSDLLSLLEVGTDPYRLMHVNPDGSYLFQAISLPTSVSYSGAICQYYGPIGCSLNPPLPTENMTYNWNGSLATGSIIDYTCKVGYFVNGNISWNIQSVQCMGILGGWVPSNFLPCLSAPVCENSTIVTSSPLVTNVTTSDSFFINGSMTFQCPPNMAFADGNTTLNAYCDGNASQYLFLPSVIPSCSVCSGVPQNISNATTNYDPTVSYAINDTIIVTCADGYMTGYGLQSQTMPCHETGWNMTYVGCRNSCSYYPPVNGAFTVSNYTATSSNKIGTKITLECVSEYYFLQNYHNQALNTTATITCSSWGHWYSTRFGVSMECAKMCVANPPLPKDNANNTWNGYSRNNGSKINITCHDGYLLENFQSDVTIKCLFPAWGADSLTNFNCSEACMTLLPTSFANATTNWTTFGIVGSQATYNCNPGYYTPNGSTEFVATCLATVGWSFSTDDYCVEAVIPICAPDPPAAPANGTSSWDGISNQNGTNVTYTCPNGDLSTIACEAPAWQTISLTNFTCTEVCSGNPPADPANAISSWDGISYQNGTKVTYACLNGYLFGNYQSAITIACEAPDWQTISLTNFTCTEACLSLPPEIFANATTNWTTFGVVGSQVIYSCNPGYMTASGLAYFVAICQATVGWFFPPASSFCKQACLVPVRSMNSSAIMKYNGTIEGSTANYTCARGFSTTVQVTFITSTCTNGTWTPLVIPNCLTITTPGPTTIPPIVLPTSNVSTLYPDTATVYFGSLNNLHPTSGIANDYALVNSLIGFGQGIYLNSQKDQCMDKSPFATSQSCEINPANCPKGMSFSIWALVLFNDSVYDMTTLTPEDDQYFISTGADMKGHPGIALGIAKQWLFALVSTGSQYWHTKILGQISNNTWNNVGVRWSTTLGMEVYVNATKVGSTQVVNTVAPLPAHSVPTLLLGCQKTSSDTNFTGHFNGYLDEFAMWSSVVPLTNNLSLNFLGGYNQNTSNISPAEFAAMLKNVLINNPAQQAAAVSILTQLSSSPSTAASPSPSPSPTATGTNASPTSASSAAEQSATVPPASVGNLKTIGNILTMMMDPTKLPTSITAAQAATFLKLSQSFSNVLGPEHSAAWIQIQKSTETVGVMQLVQLFRAWSSKLVQVITWTNESIPFCNEIVTANLYIKYCKMTIGDFGSNYGKVIQLPDYSKPSLQSLRTMWNETLTDRLAFSTQIFPDDRCTDRAVSYVFHYYGFAHLAAVSIANPMYVSSSAFTSVDSRLMNVDITSDPAYDEFGNIDTSQPLCNFDAEAMYAHQLISKNTHINNNAAKVTPRKLMLFENMTVSDVQQRYCVFWNENLTDYGAWDSSNCAISEDAREYSKCACNSFGVISILAVKSEPIEVPDEPKWIFIVKYIFYGLSVFAIIIYITIVMISGDLKDQFHLCGLHLAIAILLGSIAMVLSDFDSIQSSRSSCTLIGTVMQICYGAVGMWILGLGHASFNAITAGIIGGRLLSYSTICWGVPLALSGLPFLFMLSQMGYDPRCFMGWDNIVKWVFFAPQMACAFLATFFAFVILCNLSTPALRKENLIKDYGTFCRGAAILILYLSVTWLFGLLTYMRFSFNGPNFYPIFQVLNSLSGVCLLVLIGFGSERFRSILAGQAQARHEMLRQYAFGLPNDADYPSSKNIPANTSSSASTANLVPEEQKHEPEGANKDF